MTDPLASPPDPWNDAYGHGDFAFEDPAPAGGASLPQEPLVALVECWRCGKMVEEKHPLCPYCRARLSTAPPTRSRASRAPALRDTPPLVKLFWAFAALLALGVIHGWIQHFGVEREAAPNRQNIQNHFHTMMFFEAVDSVLVLAALLWIRYPPSLVPPSGLVRILAWVYGGPTLLLLLGLNLGYQKLLQDLLTLPLINDEIVAANGLSALVWLSYCVQPAVIEELFFRGLALGCLRGTMSIHGAVLVSAIMFGMAHIYNPLGIPYLIFLGVVLGYARIASGGLILPILMHFGHNAAVLLIEKLL
jgi:membrane protease YdiL (CAAX protease family)